MSKKQSWVDAIQFNSIYRSKGSSGLYAYVKELSNGMIIVSSFETLKQSPVQRTTLHRLSDYFYGSENGVISMKQMFTNLSKTKKDLDTLEIEKVMSIAVPKYYDAFKPYHMETILKWYKIIKLTIEQINQVNGEEENN